MKKTMWTIVLFIALLSGSCKKSTLEAPASPASPTKDTLLVWKVPIYQDTARAGYSGFLRKIADDRIFGNTTKAGNSETSVISLYRVTDGVEKIWDWKDYFPGETKVKEGMMYDDRYAYINAGNCLYLVNMNTGQTVWRSKLAYNPGLVGFIGDNVFHTSGLGSNSTLYVADVTTGDWQPIFTAEGEDGFESDIKRIAGARNAHGDMILYFQNRQYNYSSFTSRVDIYAYNLTKGEILWKLEDISPQESNIFSPVLDPENRRMYFLTWHTIFCWDMDTGEEIWKVPLAAGVLASYPVLYDGKLIMKTDQGYLTAFDAETGQELYYVKQGACCIYDMTAYKGRLYYTDRSLYIVNPNTGEVLHKIGGDFQSWPPVIDAERNVMYLMDHYYMYCYKIPE